MLRDFAVSASVGMKETLGLSGTQLWEMSWEC
jgi:hypothetical protein